MNDFKARVEARVEMAKYINRVAPSIIARLRKGYRTKTDHTLFKKDHEDLRSILEWGKPEGYRYTPVIESHRYTLTIEFKNSYPVGDCTHKYLGHTLYLNAILKGEAEFVPLPLWTEGQLEQAAKDFKEITKERIRLDAQLTNIRELLGTRY